MAEVRLARGGSNSAAASAAPRMLGEEKPMGSFRMSVGHSLGKQEACRRLQQKLAAVRQSYAQHVSQLTETWEEDVLRFSFRAAGMDVSGTITVDDCQVSLDAILPLAAMMFRGLIEQRIRQELGSLLA